MNIVHHPERLDRLAASYALGTLRGGARRRFEVLARRHPSVRAAVRTWEERLASLTELQPLAEPDPNVWKRIENLVQAQPLAAHSAAASVGSALTATAEALQRALGWWRGAAVAGALVAVGAGVVGVQLNREVQSQQGQVAQLSSDKARLSREAEQLAAELRASPRVEYVAVLMDEKAQASMLVTFDAQSQKLLLRRVGSYREAPDKSLQLWGLPQGGAPKSLGVLGGDAVIRLSAQDVSVRGLPALAISLEPKGGVPGDKGPTGPVMFKGAVLQAPI